MTWMCTLEFFESIEQFREPYHECVITAWNGIQKWLSECVDGFNFTVEHYLVVKPNWIAHVSNVFRKCGGLHNSFVCSQISDRSSFISLGFRILKARTDFDVLCDMALIFSFSCNDSICKLEQFRINHILVRKNLEKCSRDTMLDHFRSSLGRCPLKLPKPPRFRHIRLKTSDFRERKITRSRATDYTNKQVIRLIILPSNHSVWKVPGYCTNCDE